MRIDPVSRYAYTGLPLLLELVMHDEDDLHEPEHDHLLDPEFHEGYDPEADAYGALDEVEEDEESLDDFDEEEDHPAWHDDCDD
jgi:hypothetical protein